MCPIHLAMALSVASSPLRPHLETPQNHRNKTGPPFSTHKTLLTSHLLRTLPCWPIEVIQGCPSSGRAFRSQSVSLAKDAPSCIDPRKKIEMVKPRTQRHFLIVYSALFAHGCANNVLTNQTSSTLKACVCITLVRRPCEYPWLNTYLIQGGMCNRFKLINL